MMNEWMDGNEPILRSHHIHRNRINQVMSFAHTTVPRIEPGRISGFHLLCGLIQIE